MASKGGVGIDLDVARVPLREADMEPFEIMVSESQERMLCVCEPARLDDVLAVCARWEVHGTAIGEVTDTGAMRIFRGDELVGDMPVAALVDDCPVYELAPQRPAAPLYDPPAATLARGGSVHDALLALLASPNLASRRPLFEQYDWIVQSRTVRRPEEADAAVLALPDGAALGVSIDGNGRRVAADPYQGTIAAMLECAANLACVGAEPLGVTNNLNFGNPEKPHIAWQLTEAVRGLGDACRALDVPVTGGNVSLYNESATGPDLPDAGHRHGRPPARRAARGPPRLRARGRRDRARRLGRGAVAGRRRAGQAVGRAAARRPARRSISRRRAAVLEAVRDAVRAGALSSCHDVAEGGLLVAVAECCLAGGVGADARPRSQRRPVVPALRRAPGRLRPLRPARGARRAGALVPLDVFGTVGGDALELTIAGETSRWALAELREAHGALGRFFP